MTTIETLDLDTVTGGASVDVNAQTRWGNIQGQFNSGERPDPDKQMRCYQQVASQASWIQASRETLRQQLQLCGPLGGAPQQSPRQ